MITLGMNPIEDRMKYLRNVTSLQLCSDTCKGCGICVEVCPHGVFEIKGTKAGKAVVVERDRCMECGACVKNCVFGALSVQSGVGCATAILQGMEAGNPAGSACCASASNACCS